MFGLMAQIIELQTNVIKEVPTRLMKDQLKAYAQLDERYKASFNKLFDLNIYRKLVILHCIEHLTLLCLIDYY